MMERYPEFPLIHTLNACPNPRRGVRTSTSDAAGRPMPDDSIPDDQLPRPQDYPFDLDRTLSAIVGVRAHIPEDGFTAGALGTERAGSGVVIDKAGLVLTVGYLIMEADTIWLTTGDGRAVPGHALAYMP